MIRECEMHTMDASCKIRLLTVLFKLIKGSFMLNIQWFQGYCDNLRMKFKQFSLVFLIYDQVTSRLDSNPNWVDYRDQGHALFLSNTNQSTTANLTAGSAAGSLHSGCLTAANSVPSPKDIAPPPFNPYTWLIIFICLYTDIYIYIYIYIYISSTIVWYSLSKCNHNSNWQFLIWKFIRIHHGLYGRMHI